MNFKLKPIYKKLHAHFGLQRWWPADSPLEVAIGAILTQNTSWLNVEKAIKALSKRGLLDADKLYLLPEKRLASLIRPAGYYNIKAKRLKNFLKFLFCSYKGKIKNMALKDTASLRSELLSVNGIGPETADSMLLYALGRPVFVIDAYTKRIFSRHKIIPPDASYEEAQGIFMQGLQRQTKLFNEYHALLVKLGKDYCLKSKPRCSSCPLQDVSRS